MSRFCKKTAALKRLFFGEFYASVLPARTASKSSSISFDGALVRRETTTMQIAEKRNASKEGVERSIRHAIEVTFRDINAAQLNYYYP